MMDKVASSDQPLEKRQAHFVDSSLFRKTCAEPFGLHLNLRITGDIIAPVEEKEWETAS